ncbi:putative MFS-type transporter YcaD (plasmid) [Pseudoseohaeicola sp. NH-UV-7]|uniref:MFS transporter n=1 Tax=unclassified Sulfitobacter TaxID=196795 RepID=UPI000E0C7D49|nr:MFS transporter [Sulfitobacter sp. JL08]AXI53350.1 MFS transporter [Sulfitobacter sp. JL08]
MQAPETHPRIGSVRTIATILFCAGLLVAGNSLFLTLLPMRANLEGFSTTYIGVLGSAYFGGFAVGCFFAPRLIMSVGHIRTFAGLAAVLTALSLSYELAVEAYVWGALRFFSGIILAALFIVVESWLNDSSTNLNRGRVLSAYIIVSNLLTMVGQQMVNLFEINAPGAFMAIAMLICLSIVPLTLIRTSTPKPIPSARINLRKLLAVSPVGVVGCLFVGAVEGAFWSMGPVFGQERGLNVVDVTILMSCFVLGGTLSQWPIGWLSDRMDRRLVISATAFGTFVTGIIIGFVHLPPGLPVYGMAVLLGAMMVPLYPLCLSHANDNAPNAMLVELSGGLLLIYSLGAALGPLAAALLMAGDRPGGLFLFIAVLLLGLAVVVCARLLTTAATPGERGQRVEFVPVPKTSASVYALEEDDETEQRGQE